MYIAILGRQPKLGIAELERVYGSSKLSVLPGLMAVLLDAAISADDITRLGGSIKLAKVLTSLDTTDWRAIEKYLAKTIPDHLKYVPEGKLRLGLSVFGLRVTPDEINATGLRLKKIIRHAGRSARIVPNKTTALNSAQVLHNKLTSPTGWELVAVANGHKTILAQTIAEQDIDAYAARDQARPARDAFVGMLPPKLAQIMINLTHPTEDAVILDPFCGTGVILQEAALLGHGVYGTDLSEKMIRYSRDNLNWLQEKYAIRFEWHLHEDDATNAKWKLPIGAVVTESYLGQPFSAPPSAEKLAEVRNTCLAITTNFLENIGRQIESGTPLCIAIPAWQDKNGRFTHLPLLLKLADLGYKQIEFKHVESRDLLYFRPDQIVARELLVLEKV